MHGIRIETRNPVQARETMRVVNEVVSELYFDGELSPGMGAVSVGANFNNTAPQAPVIEFPVAGLWRVMVRRKSRWQRCGIRYQIYYTSDGAAGGNYSLTLSMLPLDAGDTLGVLANTLTVALTLPAPAAANDIMLYEGVDLTTTIVPGSKPLLRFAFLRNAGNANLLRILSVHYTLLPG